MTIGGNAQHDLVRRETGSDPSLDGPGGGASLNLRTSVIQRSVGADTRGGSPLTLQNRLSGVFLVWGMQGTYIDIVVHDCDVVENLSEPGHVSQRLTVGTSPWINPNGSSDIEILSRRLSAQFLEESEEVLRIGSGKQVATNAGGVWSFPAVMWWEG